MNINTTEELRQVIKTLPTSCEWFDTDGEKRFNECANKMINAGMELNDIKDILVSCYVAVANEYGG
jgi:hypothetical protein